MKHKLAALLATGVMLAQMSSYNGGIPMTPGTSVPESNPATVISAPRGAVSGSVGAPVTGGSAAPASAPAPAGPAYSFGAAPAPVVSPAPQAPPR
jgi:hypothetical protein